MEGPTPLWFNYVLMLGLLLVYYLVYIFARWISPLKDTGKTWMDDTRTLAAAVIGFILPFIYMARMCPYPPGADAPGYIPGISLPGFIGMIIAFSRHKRTLLVICIGLLVLDVWWWH